MACPYFIPEKRCDSELWTHRARLPLGDGFSGQCGAPGHHGESPSDEQLKSACNLGYSACSHLPERPVADAIRFNAVRDQPDDAVISIKFAAELAHLPRGSGVLIYDIEAGCFRSSASDEVEKAALRLGRAFVDSHLQKHPRTMAAKS